MENGTKYPIKYVSKLTGLSQLLIRTWENRYDLLQPERTPTNRRLYSPEDIEKLLTIKQAIDSGFKIGDLAKMNLDDIKQHIGSDKVKEYTNGTTEIARNIELTEAIRYIINFDEGQLNNLLSKLQFEMSKSSFIREFIFPLLKEIGSLWEDGVLKVTNEHFAASIIRNTLGGMIERDIPEHSPVLIVCTPRGQHHDLVALGLAVLASMNGYRAIYLGAQVPTNEIIDLARSKGAFAILLSIIYPMDDYTLLQELKRIDENITESHIFIGGASSLNYHHHLTDTKIRYVKNSEDLFSILGQLRGL